MPFSLYSVPRNAVQTQNSHRISIIILMVSQWLCAAHHSVGQFKFHMVSPAHRHAHANGVVCRKCAIVCAWNNGPWMAMDTHISIFCWFRVLNNFNVHWARCDERSDNINRFDRLLWPLVFNHFKIVIDLWAYSIPLPSGNTLSFGHHFKFKRHPYPSRACDVDSIC